MVRPVIWSTVLSSLEACGAGGRRAEAAAHADSQFCSFNFFARRPRPKVAPVSSHQGHVYPRPVLPPLRRVASANLRWSLYCISDGGVVGKQTRQAERVASDKHTCLLWHVLTADLSAMPHKARAVGVTNRAWILLLIRVSICAYRQGAPCQCNQRCRPRTRSPCHSASPWPEDPR